jgi:glycosyltransferase involved in cell wall biosynthesis
MRIAYICYWDMTLADGVAQKINTQIGYWRRFGHDVQLFALRPHLGTPAASRPTSLAVTGRHVNRIRASSRLANAVRSYAPDVIYLRYDLFAPAIARLLRELPAAIEINSWDRGELRSRRGAAIYSEYNHRILARGARGIVCVTHELARLFSSFRKPIEVIANGIDLAKIPPANSAIPSGSRPQLVWLGSRDTPWSGIDKIVWLATHMSDCDFSLIGVSNADLPAPTPTNVRALGRLGRVEYDELLRGADTAIGTLALHRIGLREASPLKLREYLAYGLPVIAPYDDTDFIGERPWYLLHLPNTESNVRDHLVAIRTFVSAVRGKRVPREEVAVRIGADGKEARRLRFLERILDNPVSDGPVTFSEPFDLFVRRRW